MPQTGTAQLIDIRRTYLTAKASHIRETQVIGDDDEEIGAFRGSHLAENEVKKGQSKNQ